MIIRRPKLFIKTQLGFTLIEVSVSIAIIGFIAVGANMSIIQLLNQSSRNSDITTAGRNSMNAVFWISHDAQMAQHIAGVAGFPEASALSFSWEDWENVSYNATYSIVDNRLYRTYTVDADSSQTLIAEHINPDPNTTNCATENGTLVVTITSSLGAEDKVINVTQVRKVTSRPQL